jgi:hypothetical protein
MSNLEKAARLALAVLESDNLWPVPHAANAAIDSLRAALGQQQAEPVAWQDTAKLTEIVAAEDWENIDPTWHWMYRPLYAAPQQAEPVVDRMNTNQGEAK